MSFVLLLILSCACVRFAAAFESDFSIVELFILIVPWLGVVFPQHELERDLLDRRGLTRNEPAAAHRVANKRKVKSKSSGAKPAAAKRTTQMKTEPKDDTAQEPMETQANTRRLFHSWTHQRSQGRARNIAAVKVCLCWCLACFSRFYSRFITSRNSFGLVLPRFLASPRSLCFAGVFCIQDYLGFLFLLSFPFAAAGLLPLRCFAKTTKTKCIKEIPEIINFRFKAGVKPWRASLR